MHDCPDDPAVAALCRIVGARLAMPGAGVFALHGDALHHLGGAGRLSAAGADGSGRQVPRWQRLPLALLRGAGSDAVTRLDPALLGRDCAFGAVRPIAEATGAIIGGIVVLDTRPRRISRAMTRALDDAAVLLAPLLARDPHRPPPGDPRAGARMQVKGPILPRAAAQRIIETSLRDWDPGAPFALLMVDLDRFRAVNEALGPAAGDALLATTGARLERALGPRDRLVRLEGDRFLILAGHPGADLRRFAHHLLAVIGRPLALAGRNVSMHASIGMVAGQPGDLPSPAILMQADTALSQAKTAGGNRIVLHEPRLNMAALDRSRLELDLSHALVGGQMHLVYQPYMDLVGGGISGVEALLRWRHPTRGEIEPATFIPLAEATGLILPLGIWALEAACRRALHLPQDQTMSVNISALQFHQPVFTAQVEAVLAQTGLAAERLELEITETVLMRDNSETTAQIEALIAQGVRIALDDFGTGYSALAYLGRLPHHRIKLDRSFVQDLANPATAELIRAIIALARANGVAVTAEGVERREQLAQVRAMGFSHAQGFAIGAPLAELAAHRAEAPAA